MQKCCIKGCDSSKHKETKDFCYFNFPIHDKLLLEKWRNRIQLPKWKPTYQICSMHFSAQDIDRRPNATRLFLKPTSVPTIFPVQTAITIKSYPTYRNSVFTTTMTKLPIQTINVDRNENCNESVIKAQLMSRRPVQEHVQTSIKLPINRFGQKNIQNNSQKFDSRRTRLYPSCGQSESRDRQLAISRSKFKKILPQPESLCKPVPKSNFLIIPSSDLTDNSNNSTTSVPSCYLGEKRVILRISVYKLHDGSPEANCSKHSVDSVANCASCVNDKENGISDNKNPHCKEITIENSSTNRAVTFRLDPSTGEIVLAPDDKSLVNKQKCARSTSVDQKSPVVRKVSRVVRGRPAKVRRNTKKTEIIATMPPIKRLRGNSRITRSSCKTR